MLSDQKGYRGYVFSRPVDSHRVPQHIQNLVIRDYAARRKLHYLLSATEYAMPGCYLILEQVLADLAARTLSDRLDLPLGSFTAFVGAPYFLLALRASEGRT